MICYKNVGVDIDTGNFRINDKMLTAQELEELSDAYRLFCIASRLKNEYMDDLYDVLGENCSDENIFEVATKVKSRISEYELCPDDLEERECDAIEYILEKLYHG